MWTMAKQPKPVSPKWAKRLIALQTALGLDNDAMADKFGVGVRTYRSWKYGERNPSPTAVKLIDLFTPKS